MDLFGKKNIINVLLSIMPALLLVAPSIAAPNLLSCISYMENDGTMQDEIDFDEYVSSSNQVETDHWSQEISVPTTPLPYQRRICPSDYTFCFALWRQTENGTHIEKQGCWKESTERNATCNQKACISWTPTTRNNSLYYCCCAGDICNQNVSVASPQPTMAVFPESSNFENNQYQSDPALRTVVFWCFVAVVCMMTTILAAYYLCQTIKKTNVAEEAPLAPSGPGYSSNLRNVDNINLVCMLGRGKYGTVMKGILHDKEVAVKIYPESHYQYYVNERNIYSLPMMESPSLLTYFGYDEHHTMDGKKEYQLVLSLAPLGCLQDWLIANVMDFKSFCLMARSVARGISHLHTEIRCGEKVKPCIAHRDLNSRNILVKADQSCCIADFGFALKVFGSKYEYKGEVAAAETKSITEVGTLRYMSPELLEGAVNLRDCETSLKQMDVYALGLILWELATRCSDFYYPAKVIPPYKGPYELEVGTHPTFDQMQALVVRHKARPLFPTGWGGGPASKVVRDTCEDCWDHDAEARLTSLCAEERMQEVGSIFSSSNLHTQAVSPLGNTNNLISDLNVEASQKLIYKTADITNSLEKIGFNLPPNQQISNHENARKELENRLRIINTPVTEKNHLIHPQQQLQPYQGRNPCQERNLAPIVSHLPQVLVQKSRKHTFRSSEENSFSCLEDDVSVEELLSSGNSSKYSCTTNTSSSMGHGFPKQHNTEKKLRGWHGVRALIQKRLFRKEVMENIFPHLEQKDEKSNLVDTHHIVSVNALGSLCNGSSLEIEAVNLRNGKRRDVSRRNKRPSNLYLATVPAQGNISLESNTIHISESVGRYNDENDSKMKILSMDIRQKNLDSESSSMLEKESDSSSSGVVRQESVKNNGFINAELQNLTNSNSTKKMLNSGVHHIRRQNSLDIFHEVFSGRGSTDRLRNPSQRVKTPGDVPPSVRRLRASKTLSLYDDRMMGSSATLNNHIL